MKLNTEQALEKLFAEEPCYGAAFCSYTFDPAFFENQILRGVLRIGTDPTEDTLRFLIEARVRLQETPVVCMVDAGMRQPGRRLPYDLLEVSQSTFHPKLALLLFGTYARLIIGSGNLTRGGYGENSEMFFRRDLPYDDAAAVGLLKAVAEFLREAGQRAGGSQLTLLLEELGRRTRGVDAVDPTDIVFLHSIKRAILPGFLSLIPESWTVQRISLMAPFHEQDDAQSGLPDELFSVAMKMAERAKSIAKLEVEIGVSWDDSPVRPSDSAPYRLEERLGELWGRIEERGEEQSRVEYFQLLELLPKQVRVLDQRGEARRWSRDELEAGLAQARVFPVQKPQVYGPVRAARSLAEQGAQLAVELYPARRVEGGRPSRRPLHAKLLLVEAAWRGRSQTWVLVGSANASRAALLRSVEDGGNVETCIAFALEGSHRLADFAPELFRVPLDAVEILKREFPVPGPNLARWIESAVYHAEERQLAVAWAKTAEAPLGAWQLHYKSNHLASGDGPPDVPTFIENFILAADSAELILSAGKARAAIPILVDDLADLPPSPELAGLSLDELLALLGRRIDTERLGKIRSPGSRVPVSAVLTTIFGEGFGPVDVFKAWWNLARDLSDPRHSFQSFRLLLDGPYGARAVWSKLREAVSSGARSTDEGWFYGAELSKTIRELTLSESVDRAERQELLTQFACTLDADCASLLPPTAGRAWLDPIVRFYGGQP